MREHDHEPVRGLPERLPAGEALLWQGAPRWSAIAVRVFHVRKLALYFGVLILWRVSAGMVDGQATGALLSSALWLGGVAVAAIGVLTLLAIMTARATIYTITDKRVVMRFGIALTMALNLPLRKIDAAALKLHRDGTGELALTLANGDRIAYLHLWPHARPWRIAHPQPMLRGLDEPERVAAILTRALAATGGVTTTETRVASAPVVIHGELAPAAN